MYKCLNCGKTFKKPKRFITQINQINFDYCYFCGSNRIEFFINTNGIKEVKT